MHNLNKVISGKFSSYQIVDIIDHGGMSVIYDAISTDDGKGYAIKLLRDLDSNIGDSKKVLAKEGLIHLHLKHPSICQVHDYCIIDNRPGLILDKLTGQSLANILHKYKNLPINDALTIISEVASALDFAHNICLYHPESKIKSILHRDIKPENIYITDDGLVKLLDFGISSIESKNDQSYPVTTGFTEYYTCPDLFDENSVYQPEGYTSQHDIYVLGLVFYEMITGYKALSSIALARGGEINCPSKYISCPSSLLEITNTWLSNIPKKRFKEIKDLRRLIDFELKRIKKVDLTQYGQMCDIEQESMTTSPLALTIIEGRKNFQVTESFFQSWLLVYCINASRIDPNTTAIKDIIAKYGKLSSDINNSPNRIKLDSVESLINLLYKYSCEGSGVSKYDFESSLTNLEDFRFLITYSGNESAASDLYLHLKKILKDLKLGYSQTNKTLYLYRTLFKLSPHDILKKTSTSISTEIDIYDSLLNSSQIQSAKAEQFDSGEKNAFLYFLWKMAHCDGDICRKERELINSTSIVFGNAMFNRELLINKTEEEIFLQVSPANRLYFLGLMIKTAFADEVLANQELDIIRRTIRLIAANQRNEYSDIDLFKFIKEVFESKIHSTPHSDFLTNEIQSLNIPFEAVKKSVHRLYCLSSIMSMPSFLQKDQIDAFLCIFSKTENSPPHKNLASDVMVELAYCFQSQYFHQNKDASYLPWINGKVKIRPLEELNTENGANIIKNFLIEIFNYNIKSNASRIEITASQEQVLARHISEFLISRESLSLAFRDIYLDLNYKVKIQGFHL